LVCHQQLQTNSITICHWPQKPQMHSTWILPQQQSLNPLWHWKSIFGQTGHAYTRSFQHYQLTTTPNQWYCSHTAITNFCWVHRHLPIAAIFWILQLRTRMWYLSHYDIMMHSHINTWHHNKISKARRANEMTCDSNYKSDSLSICKLLSTKHLLHMTTT
jgi:hypothetical protein